MSGERKDSFFNFDIIDTISIKDVSVQQNQSSLSFSDSSRFDITSDFDPEFIKTSLRDFAQKLKDLERERDEAIAQCGGLERQLVDLENDRNECEQRVQTLQKNLQDTEEGKTLFTLPSIISNRISLHRHQSRPIFHLRKAQCSFLIGLQKNPNLSALKNLKINHLYDFFFFGVKYIL